MLLLLLVLLQAFTGPLSASAGQPKDGSPPQARALSKCGVAALEDLRLMPLAGHNKHAGEEVLQHVFAQV
jgi:hypothetical protein